MDLEVGGRGLVDAAMKLGYDALRAGKPPEPALTAIMRKLPPTP